MEQQSKEWFEARIGRFTASQMDRLLGKITLKTTTDKINLYCQQKAGEMYFGISDELEYLSKDMQRGIDLEPLAFEKFADEMNAKFLTVKKMPFVRYNEHSGASPDGQVSNGDNLEIKCPTIETFTRLVLTSEINPKYFAQMQMQMLCTGAELTHFYNYVIHNGQEFSHTIEVPRCEETISLLKERIDYATKIKLDYYNLLVQKLS